ncbi:MAG TPA: beta-propeller fold lactonase family protein [Candidatus Limnocylindria bacterium]|jgi:DNA-binding beta-propeller fold protein YncE|nr:beta-propeller fold lactonase family protein [Candidatus Limnocylindria bacterium]
MLRRAAFLLALCSLPVLARTGGVPPLAPVLPGAKVDGSVLLPNQWSLRPVGKQVVLGDFPVNITLHPSGRYCVVLHSGYGAHELTSVALPAGKVVARVEIAESFYGLAFSPDGSHVYCSGAGDEVIHEFAFKEGYFGEPQDIRLRAVTERGVPGGFALSADGQRLFAANVFGQDVIVADLALRRPTGLFPLRPGMPAVDLSRTRVPDNLEEAAVVKRAVALLDTIPSDAPFPYSCVYDEPRGRLYVSLWAQAEVLVLDAQTGAVQARWKAEEHPCELLLSKSGKVLYVANAARNSVTVFDAESGRTLETLSAAMAADALPGSTPNSLALTPDGEFLFVANAGNNNVAVFDVEKPGKSRSLGFIPVGWYPTSVRVTPDGKNLLVANGKGLLSHANRNGPQPGREPASNVREYIGSLFTGTLSIIPLPKKGEAFEEKMREFTARAFKCSPPSTPAPVTKGGRENPVPSRVGGKSPIRYVIYVIKENRTYDQVLGDLAGGNGDPSLCLFDERVTPNHHALAREFVLLDNFYVDSEVSADGHEWSVGGYATDFVEKTWPLNYGHNAKGKVPYPSEGTLPVAYPASGYLWDRARQAGVSFRSYGEFCAVGTGTNEPAHTRIASLEGHFDPGYRPWDLTYPDVRRAEHFAEELKRFERAGDMPRLQILRLPNDHTYGTAAGRPTPSAMVADNDLALGKLVEAVSHSKFWPQTAIFILEDDAQNGPDHVDAHRSIAFAISPYVRRHARDSAMYSTCSMLRTMELILGLKPMTQFDEAAAPMFAVFQAAPDLRPYRALPATADLHEKNVATAWGSRESATMDFTKEDAVDDLLLNRVIWHAVKGPDRPMPSPVRAAFVLGGGDDD